TVSGMWVAVCESAAGASVMASFMLAGGCDTSLPGALADAVAEDLCVARRADVASLCPGMSRFADLVCPQHGGLPARANTCKHRGRGGSVGGMALAIERRRSATTRAAAALASSEGARRPLLAARPSRDRALDDAAGRRLDPPGHEHREGLARLRQEVGPRQVAGDQVQAVDALPLVAHHAVDAAHDLAEAREAVRAEDRLRRRGDAQHVGEARAARDPAVEDDAARTGHGLARGLDL